MNIHVHGHSRLVRFVALLMSLLLVAASCGSTEASTGDDTGEGESEEDSGLLVAAICEDLELPEGDRKIELTDVEIEFVAEFCGQFGGNDLLGSITLTPCGDGLFPEITHSSEGPVFYSHGVIRFHPADELNDGGASPEYVPADAIGSLDPVDGAVVYVVDEEGDHIAMVSAVIEQLTGIEPNQLPLGPLMTESAILEMIKEIDGGTETFLNMSFGTYTCDPAGPTELGDRLADLDSQGVQLFASAGNDETEQPSFPAAFSEVLSVGSVAKDLTTRSCFSNFGSTVDVFLIGEEVITDVGQWSGTSFAAPQALSVAASGSDPAGVGAATVADLTDLFDVAWIDPGGVEQASQTFCGDGTGYEPTLQDLEYR